MNKLAKYLQILIFISFLPSGLHSQIDPILASRLQNLVDSIRIYKDLRGVSAAVIIPGQPGIWTGVSGISHGTVNITPGMKFWIASNTKTFMSVLMLKLQELNILSLDDSLHEWLPNFQYVNPNITIRQLLNHSSGVYDIIDNPQISTYMNSDTGRYWTPEELLATFLDSAYFNPGQGGEYSNTNYTLAGMIIKAATDTSVSHNLRQYIFNRLNMTSTYFSREESISDTIAHGWRRVGGNFEFSYPWTSWASAQWCYGNIYSTPENLVRWYDSLFAGRIVNQSSLNQMLTFVPNTSYSGGYGLGIYRVYRTQGGLPRTKYQHDGFFQRGYRTVMRIDSTYKYIISVLVNQVPADSIYLIVNGMDNLIRNFIITTGFTQNNEIIPNSFQLHQNYPNPFNPMTNIKFEIPKASFVKMLVYDITGREAAVLVNQELKTGSYTVDWDATNYPSGVYFYKVIAGENSETRKMVLVK